MNDLLSVVGCRDWRRPLSITIQLKNDKCGLVCSITDSMETLYQTGPSNTVEVCVCIKAAVSKIDGWEPAQHRALPIRRSTLLFCCIYTCIAHVKDVDCVWVYICRYSIPGTPITSFPSLRGIVPPIGGLTRLVGSWEGWRVDKLPSFFANPSQPRIESTIRMSHNPSSWSISHSISHHRHHLPIRRAGVRQQAGHRGIHS